MKVKYENQEYWIYYPEQCKYCLNRPECNYTYSTRAALQALRWLEKNIEAYGSYDFKCDYFAFDYETWTKEEKECTCG